MGVNVSPARHHLREGYDDVVCHWCVKSAVNECRGYGKV